MTVLIELFLKKRYIFVSYDQRAGIIRVYIFNLIYAGKRRFWSVTAFINYGQNITFKTYWQMKWINSLIWLLVWYLISYIMEKNWNLAETYGKKGFVYCCTETCTSGFRWQKLDGIQLKLCNSFRIAETIQETPTPNFYLVSSSVLVLLKRYFSSSVENFDLICFMLTYFTSHVEKRNTLYILSFDIQKSSICVVFLNGITKQL